MQAHFITLHGQRAPPANTSRCSVKVTYWNGFNKASLGNLQGSKDAKDDTECKSIVNQLRQMNNMRHAGMKER